LMSEKTLSHEMANVECVFKAGRFSERGRQGQLNKNHEDQRETSRSSCPTQC